MPWATGCSGPGPWDPFTPPQALRPPAPGCSSLDVRIPDPVPIVLLSSFNRASASGGAGPGPLAYARSTFAIDHLWSAARAKQDCIISRSAAAISSSSSSSNSSAATMTGILSGGLSLSSAAAASPSPLPASSSSCAASPAASLSASASFDSQAQARASPSLSPWIPPRLRSKQDFAVYGKIPSTASATSALGLLSQGPGPTHLAPSSLSEAGPGVFGGFSASPSFSSRLQSGPNTSTFSYATIASSRSGSVTQQQLQRRDQHNTSTSSSSFGTASAALQVSNSASDSHASAAASSSRPLQYGSCSESGSLSAGPGPGAYYPAAGPRPAAPGPVTPSSSAPAVIEPISAALPAAPRSPQCLRSLLLEIADDPQLAFVADRLANADLGAFEFEFDGSGAKAAAARGRMLASSASAARVLRWASMLAWWKGEGACCSHHPQRSRLWTHYVDKGSKSPAGCGSSPPSNGPSPAGPGLRPGSIVSSSCQIIPPALPSLSSTASVGSTCAGAWGGLAVPHAAGVAPTLAHAVCSSSASASNSASYNAWTRTSSAQSSSAATVAAGVSPASNSPDAFWGAAPVARNIDFSPAKADTGASSTVPNSGPPSRSCASSSTTSINLSYASAVALAAQSASCHVAYGAHLDVSAAVLTQTPSQAAAAAAAHAVRIRPAPFDSIAHSETQAGPHVVHGSFSSRASAPSPAAAAAPTSTAAARATFATCDWASRSSDSGSDDGRDESTTPDTRGRKQRRRDRQRANRRLGRALEAATVRVDRSIQGQLLHKGVPIPPPDSASALSAEYGSLSRTSKSLNCTAPGQHGHPQLQAFSTLLVVKSVGSTGICPSTPRPGICIASHPCSYAAAFKDFALGRDLAMGGDDGGDHAILLQAFEEGAWAAGVAAATAMSTPAVDEGSHHILQRMQAGGLMA